MSAQSDNARPGKTQGCVNNVNGDDGCRFGCTGDDVTVHYGWFRCNPESRAMLADEHRQLAEAEEAAR
jgi:hypothetical protein